MKNVKYIIFSILGLLPALAAFFSMLYYNAFYALLGSNATLLCWLFPAIAIIYLGALIFILFNKKENKFAIPIFTVLLSLVLAFTLISDASNSKIEADFLDNELVFNQAIKDLKKEYYVINGNSYTINAGTFDLKAEELFSTIPTKQVKISKIDETHAAFLFITLDNEVRTEGYAYLPDGTPFDWDPLNMEWSEPLDLEGNWCYVCIYK